MPLNLPTQQPIRVDTVAWERVLPWVRLGEALPAALRPASWLLGTLLLLLLLGGWTLIAWLAGEVPASVTFGPVSFRGGMQSFWMEYPLPDSGLFWMLYIPYALLVKGWLGSIICRLAAGRAARREHESLGEAGRFVTSRLGWFYLAPLIPLGLALLLLGVVAVLALPLNVPWLDILGGLLFGPMLGLTLLATLLLVGLALGGVLLWPAIAVEGTDAFDAISRAYNFLISRPVYFVFLVALLGLLLWVVAAIVAAVGSVTLQLTASAAGWLVFTDGALTAPAAWLVGAWRWLFSVLLGGLLVSLAFSGMTYLYLLMRHAVDGVAIGEVYGFDSPSTATTSAADDDERETA